MRRIILLLAVVLFAGCGGQKQVNKTETHRTYQEQGVRIKLLPKDSIVYVPNLKLVPKDTVIVVENKHLRLRTDIKNGRVKKVKATQKPQAEINPYERTGKEDVYKKEKHTEREPAFRFSPVWLIYLFLFIAGLIAVNNFTKPKPKSI